MRELELAQLKAQGPAEQARFVDLAEATLKALESAIPAALDEYDRLLRSDEGLLKSDAGRFHSQNPEAVKTVFRYVMEARFNDLLGLNPDDSDDSRIDFGENERKKRIEIVKAALTNIKREPAAAFDASTSPSAARLTENAAWASRIFETLSSRNALLESYVDAFPAGTDVSGLPTLEEEINANFTRRIATREAMRNEVDAQVEQERAKREAELAEKIGREKLEAYLTEIEEIAAEERRIAAAIHEREMLQRDQQLQQVMAQIKAEQEKHAAQMAQERAEFDKQLAQMALQIERLQAQADKAADTATMEKKTRELPANAKVILAGLSAKGTWKPSKPGGNTRMLMGTSSQYGLDPQPHSLGTIAGIGALDDTSLGVYTMYAILAFKGDTDRPRMDANYACSQNLASFYWWEQTETAELNKAPATTKRIREIQALIREFGEELVEQGYLAP
ncbi:MAG: hypothetical protein AAF394_13570 [Planctomycetota bacterium]